MSNLFTLIELKKMCGVKRRGTIQTAEFDVDKKNDLLTITEYYHDDVIFKHYFRKVLRRWAYINSDRWEK